MKQPSDEQNHPHQPLTVLTYWWRQANVATDLGRILLIVLLALGLGLIYNVVIVWPNRPSTMPSHSPATTSEITMEQVYQLMQRGEVVVVDTRDPTAYADEHIAGAVNLPSGQFDSYYPDFASQVGKDQSVILYCAAGCDSKQRVAKKLRDRGYQHVTLMEPSPEEWAAAGYPVTTGKDPGRVEAEQQ